jgi:hypothetical protein
MGIFKNIFCAICNPPEYHEDFLIDQCDNTTSINRKACSSLPFLEASFPYKNYLCLTCQQGFEKTEFFADVHIDSTSETYDKMYEYPFVFTISIAYTYANLNSYIHQYFGASNTENKVTPLFNKDNKHTEYSIEYSPKYESIIPPMEQQNGIYTEQFLPRPYRKNSSSFVGVPLVNVTNLIRKSFAFTRNGACTPGLLPDYTIPLQKPCSCTIGCRSDCCDDFALKVTWTCIDDHYFRDGNTKEFLVIGGCMERENLEDLCKNNITSHFFHLFPLTSTTGYGETYANVFCYLCNNNVNQRELFKTGYFAEGIKVWPFEAECKTFINYRNFYSLQNLIASFKINSCVLSVLPHSTVSKCNDAYYEDTNAIGRCNVSGTWLHFDEDVVNTCENMGPYTFPPIEMNQILYKNKFCKICNPFQSTKLSSSCSTVHEYNIIGKACFELPTIDVCFPFQNVFCKMCVNNVSESQCSEKDEGVNDLPGPPGAPGMPGPPGTLNNYQLGPPAPRDGPWSPFAFGIPNNYELAPPPPPAPRDGPWSPVGPGTFRSSFSLRAYYTPSIVNGQEKVVACQHNQIVNEFEVIILG